MGILFDKATRIVYNGYVIDFDMVMKQEEGPKTYSLTNLLGKREDGSIPYDDLVLTDILNLPLEIYREPYHGELLLSAVACPREGEIPKYERHYTRLILNPQCGRIEHIRKRPTGCPNLELVQEVAGKSTLFDTYKNMELEVMIYHRKERVISPHLQLVGL